MYNEIIVYVPPPDLLLGAIVPASRGGRCKRGRQARHCGHQPAIPVACLTEPSSIQRLPRDPVHPQMFRWGRFLRKKKPPDAVSLYREDSRARLLGRTRRPH